MAAEDACMAERLRHPAFAESAPPDAAQCCICASIEQITNEGAAQIVRAEDSNAGSPRAGARSPARLDL